MIIRKGDKVAEAELRKRARKQNISRIVASDEKKRKAGLESTIGKTVKKTDDGKTKATKFSDKSETLRRVKSESPVSGSAITKEKIANIKDPKERAAARAKFSGEEPKVKTPAAKKSIKKRGED
jgi:hypothetical protein